jgi:hypothetical protein
MSRLATSSEMITLVSEVFSISLARFTTLSSATSVGLEFFRSLVIGPSLALNNVSCL